MTKIKMNSFKLIHYYKKFGITGFYLKFFKDYIMSFINKFKRNKNDAKWYFKLASTELKLYDSYRIIETSKTDRKDSKANEDKNNEDLDLYPLI